jgi:prepilin-type N-terminal cleavage/methylation domain-containing protein
MFLRFHNRRRRAFTITELMVAVSLMSLIVLALYAMFNQTQRALRANEAQIDSNERGRGVLELVSREIESARVGNRPGVTNLFVTLSPWGKTLQGDLTVQTGPGAFNLTPRTNAFDSIFYMTKTEKAWRGVSYAVLQVSREDKDIERVGPLSGSMGTLVRYETPNAEWNYGFPTTNLFKHFVENRPRPGTKSDAWPAATNFSQIANGIVHFRLRPFDTTGRVLAFNSTNLDSHYHIYRMMANGSPLADQYMSPELRGDREATNKASVILRQTLPNDATETSAAFRSNALPAYLELELGVLEPETMRQYSQMIKDGLNAQAETYLGKRIAKVQIYRKRIPLRTVSQ